MKFGGCGLERRPCKNLGRQARALSSLDKVASIRSPDKVACSLPPTLVSARSGLLATNQSIPAQISIEHVFIVIRDPRS